MVVAGFDPSGGAGITADIKTVAAHGLYGTSAITALTVQTTQGVSRWEPVSPETVQATLEALIEDSPPAAVKIGMLGSGKAARCVAEVLRAGRLRNVILDPVIRSTLGAELIDSEGLDILRSELVPLADVITPNLAEAALLAGIEVRDLPSMEESARRLRQRGARSVVITGGHLPEPVDLLAEGSRHGALEFRRFPGSRVDTGNTHGTGCAFSTALACNLALGKSLPDAVAAAKEYVTKALRTSYSVGKGPGPINHLFEL